MAEIININRAKTITITLSSDEAFALDELVDSAMLRLVSNAVIRRKYKKHRSMETAASACDKVRQAILAEPNPRPWRQSLKELELT